MIDNKTNVPQFVACGLEMGNCPRQIPYDMEEHDKIIMTDLLDKVEKKIREHSGLHYVDCDGYFGGTAELIFKVDYWLDDIIADMKAEVKEC